MFKLRNYQEEASKQGLEILKIYKILILNYEVRLGKSHIALDIGKHYKNVLFITKKKAINSVLEDYKTAKHNYNLIVINYESLHKVTGVFDLVICDESNEKISAYPKPTQNAKRVKEFVTNDLILLTGTLLPESNSQIYHQLWVSKFSPFAHYKNFYAFHRALGVPEVVYTTYGQSKSYKNTPYKNIEPFINPIKLSYTQKQAGFKNEIKDIIHKVAMKKATKTIIKQLKKDNIVQGKNEVIIADSGVKLMSKLHQLSTGTIKFDSGESMILDTNKIDFVKQKFHDKKIAIFYKFKEELNLIKSVFDLAGTIEEFNTTDKNIAFQFISGRSGIKLDKADCIVAINIDYSATTFQQFRARMVTSETLVSEIHWIFSDIGFEDKVLKTVKNKENFTLQTF